MKKSMYFKTKDDVLEYYGALENIPSTDLVIVEDTGSMYAVSNNASIDGEMTPTGGETASDSPWIETEDLASILSDPKSLELPLHIDAVNTCISSSFSFIRDSEENITSAEYIYEVTNKNDITTLVKVIVNNNEHDDLYNATDLEDSLNDYDDDIYNNIHPILTDCTLSIYEDGKNTRSMTPQYVLEGKIYAWNLNDNIYEALNITENGFYVNNGEVVGFNVDVPTGTSYTITSAYMTDMMNQKLDDFESADNVLSYEFSLDASHSSDTLGCVATINESYTAYFAPSLYISDPGNDGTFTQNGYINLSEWASSNTVQIDPTLIMDQPNIEVDVNMVINTTPSLYGYPVEYEYIVRGYTAVEKIKVQYWEMSMSEWIDSIELVDDGNGAFEGDFWPASGYPIRFLSSESGELFADLQQDTTISSDLASPIDLAFSSEYTLYFNINGICHIVIGKDSNGYKLNELTKNEYVEIRNDNNVYQLYQNQNSLINLVAGTLEFTDKDNNTLNIATVINPDTTASATSSIDLDVPGVYTIQVSDTQGSDAALTLQNWTNKNITVGNLVLPASDDSDKIWSIDITVGGV